MQQTIPEDAFSYISPVGYRNSTSCGYCRAGQSQKRHSYYARATALNTGSYQALIDRCWRRSGNLLYRPNQRDSCCPHYTLRLDSSRFRPAKDQRQTLNRFNRFVIGEAYAKEAARLYPKTREEARKRDTEFNLIDRVHEGEDQSLKQPPRPAHVFAVTLEPDNFTEEKYAVFENYQRIVHREPSRHITREGFRRFLCSSPLKREIFSAPDGRERRVGSFHQCYRLDGQLVAIGVLDLLPDCVSAVYFLYHESIHKWSPGKLGALREIALAAEMGYRWWYSGFYIHTCPKMKYKIDFSPQYILNPSTMEWLDLADSLLAKFDDHGYLHFPSIGGDGAGSSPGSKDVAEPESQRNGMSKMEVDLGAEPEEEDDDDADLSLFRSNMPGIPSVSEMESVNLDNIFVRLNKGYCLADDLFEWEGQSIKDERSPKAMVAELVAAVGSEIMSTMCLDFRRT